MVVGRQRGPRVPEHRPRPDLQPQIFFVFSELFRISSGGREVVQQVEGLLEVNVVGRAILDAGVELEREEMLSSVRGFGYNRIFGTI